MGHATHLAFLPVISTQVRGRKYPWGVVELENEEHCDYVKIRSMLIRSHMQVRVVMFEAAR
jgi:septin family protein